MRWRFIANCLSINRLPSSAFKVSIVAQAIKLSMTVFFSNFALENLKRAPAKADTHYFLRARKSDIENIGVCVNRTLHPIFQDCK